MPITGADGNPNVFKVKRNDDGQRWLNGNNGKPDDFWLADGRWVFVRSQVALEL